LAAQTAAVDLLLSAGAAADTLNSRHESALFLAATSGALPVVRSLLNARADAVWSRGSAECSCVEGGC
jgi:ankyrin repeat protein